VQKWILQRSVINVPGHPIWCRCMDTETVRLIASQGPSLIVADWFVAGGTLALATVTSFALWFGRRDARVTRNALLEELKMRVSQHGPSLIVSGVALEEALEGPETVTAGHHMMLEFRDIILTDGAHASDRHLLDPRCA
jgi:hypothetical protein